MLRIRYVPKHSKIKFVESRFLVLAVVLLAALAVPESLPGSEQNREYQIKAAFLYNFIQFVDWPEERIADNNEPIIIGIIGKDPFGGAFEPLKDKRAKDKSVVIRRFEGFKESPGKEDDKAKLSEKIKMLRQCHLLFISSSEKEYIGQILDSLKNYSVLTIADIDGFLESGGIINFVMKDKKVQFEINVTAAEQAKLKIRSKLLRLATRRIPQNAVGQGEEK